MQKCETLSAFCIRSEYYFSTVCKGCHITDRGNYSIKSPNFMIILCYLLSEKLLLFDIFLLVNFLPNFQFSIFCVQFFSPDKYLGDFHAFRGKKFYQFFIMTHCWCSSCCITWCQNNKLLSLCLVLGKSKKMHFTAKINIFWIAKEAFLCLSFKQS